MFVKNGRQSDKLTRTEKPDVKTPVGFSFNILFSPAGDQEQYIRGKSALFGQVILFSEEYLGFGTSDKIGFFRQKKLKAGRLNVTDEIVVCFQNGSHFYKLSDKSNPNQEKSCPNSVPKVFSFARIVFPVGSKDGIFASGNKKQGIRNN
jgi:hypothetical protein